MGNLNPPIPESIFKVVLSVVLNHGGLFGIEVVFRGFLLTWYTSCEWFMVDVICKCNGNLLYLTTSLLGQVHVGNVTNIEMIFILSQTASNKMVSFSACVQTDMPACKLDHPPQFAT